MPNSTVLSKREKKEKAEINKKNSIGDSWHCGSLVFTRKEVINIITDQRKRIYDELVSAYGVRVANSVIRNSGITKF